MSNSFPLSTPSTETLNSLLSKSNLNPTTFPTANPDVKDDWVSLVTFLSPS